MTRKQYTHKIQQLTIAIYKHPESTVQGCKLGTALKRTKDNAKNVPATFGSYEAAWNCDVLRWAREYYGVN